MGVAAATALAGAVASGTRFRAEVAELLMPVLAEIHRKLDGICQKAGNLLAVSHAVMTRPAVTFHETAAAVGPRGAAWADRSR